MVQREFAGDEAYGLRVEDAREPEPAQHARRSPGTPGRCKPGRPSATILRGSRARPARSRVASTLNEPASFSPASAPAESANPSVSNDMSAPAASSVSPEPDARNSPAALPETPKPSGSATQGPSISAAAATSSPARRASARQRAPASSTSTRPRPPATANASKASASRPSGERRAVKRVSCTPSEPSDPARRPPSQASCHP